MTEPAAVVIKHNNPCGCALGQTLSEAFAKAYAGDPVSAFGSIVGFNRPLDAATAEQMSQPDRFIEAVIAPSLRAGGVRNPLDAAQMGQERAAVQLPGDVRPAPATLEYRSISGGLLVQDRDKAEFDRASRPSAGEAEGAEWRVVHAQIARPPTVGRSQIRVACR